MRTLSACSPCDLGCYFWLPGARMGSIGPGRETPSPSSSFLSGSQCSAGYSLRESTSRCHGTGTPSRNASLLSRGQIGLSQTVGG